MVFDLAQYFVVAIDFVLFWVLWLLFLSSARLLRLLVRWVGGRFLWLRLLIRIHLVVRWVMGVEVCLDVLEIRKWIFGKLMLICSDISKEAFSDISHYMAHGEYEMAFEYLLLEVMEIAVCLGLDRDYHYDENFWQRLSSIWGADFV